MNKFSLIAIISSLVAVLDFISKKVIVATIPLYGSINVLPFLNIVHVENRGAAFSMLSQMGNAFFVTLSLFAVTAIVMYMVKLPRGLELYALALILGGAVGNLIDRLRIGKVIDFIDVFVGEWHWPAFNVADSALTIGIILFLVANFRHSRKAGDSPA